MNRSKLLLCIISDNANCEEILKKYLDFCFYVNFIALPFLKSLIVVSLSPSPALLFQLYMSYLHSYS